MEPTEQILEWAREHIDKLSEDMTWTPSRYGTFGYWQAINPQVRGVIRARATAALDFLERFTGPSSLWTKTAHDVFENNGDNQSMETGARAIGDVLEEWSNLVRSGQIRPRLTETLALRQIASTELLEQVCALNADHSVTPAAPIVLAGAALEIALRSAVEELGLSISGQPGISTYARTLRSAEVLNKQHIKDIEQMAGLRNQAAHGEHDALSRERSGLMEQQVNIFLRTLEEVIEKSA
ncbi:hypothetical protein [Candidatus Poriferisocius sp.]|uniref:hypothetical protein n=1 Tax=Candidatus Poriferisocius sp. TaxID=3101276 RepID=UPI003B01A52D